jgi:hypothetical protein
VTLQITLITKKNQKAFQSMVARPVTEHLSALVRELTLN